MIAFRDVALRRGVRQLFSRFDGVIHTGSRVGVVGRNGCGKSSLLAALRGELDTDEGHVDVPQATRIASVAQDGPDVPEAALDYVLGGDAAVAAALAQARRAEDIGDSMALGQAHQRLDQLHGYDAEARAARLLHGLGFAPATHVKPVCEFSGGWRERLGLARALMKPSDLLLLDEPTNHLDLDAVLWLEQWLRRYSGTLLVISHDREFLDAVTTHTLHMGVNGVRIYNGNYSAFERQYDEQLRQQQQAHEREQSERTRLEAFVTRFRAKATKARQAQSRVKRLEKLVGTEAVRLERPFHFRFPEPQKLPQSMLGLERADLGYVAGEPVLRDVTLSVQAGDRIGLLGVNGAGKSTLVKTLVGALPPLAGNRHQHKDLVTGYFAQHAVEMLRDDQTPVGHLAEVAPEDGNQALRDWLGQWGFVGDRALEPVAGFSGGERARLALSLIARRSPGLLILDEPTNHLDMDMREALAEALNDYPGALVLVSHDRHLLGLVCEDFHSVRNGTVTPFPGDLEDYARWVREQDADDNGSAPATSGDTPGMSSNARNRRRSAAEERKKTASLRKRVKEKEKQLEKLESAILDVEQQLADPDLYTRDDAATVMAELSRHQAVLRKEREDVENAWLELGEELEAASA